MKPIALLIQKEEETLKGEVDAAESDTDSVAEAKAALKLELQAEDEQEKDKENPYASINDGKDGGKGESIA